jgi:hypothetical protein
MFEEWDNKTEEECTDILQKIFAGSEVLLCSIAPDGWMNSEYIHFFHPTAEQQFAEYNIMYDNLASFKKNKDEATESEPRKTLSDFQMDGLEHVNDYEEFIEILGKAVWDIFSDNHEVIAGDGKIYDLGSFRGSGDTIAEFINEYYPLSSGSLDYMDFYMGSIWINKRAGLLPFYKHIFTVLKEHNCDWRYSFPRLGIVSFKQEEPENSNPVEYDPLQAMQNELSKETSEADKLQEKLDNIYEQDYEDAKYKPLPLTVLAYKEVYGILPEGHPQKEFE